MISSKSSEAMNVRSASTHSLPGLYVLRFTNVRTNILLSNKKCIGRYFVNVAFLHFLANLETGNEREARISGQEKKHSLPVSHREMETAIALQDLAPHHTRTYCMYIE